MEAEEAATAAMAAGATAMAGPVAEVEAAEAVEMAVAAEVAVAKVEDSAGADSVMAVGLAAWVAARARRAALQW